MSFYKLRILHHVFGFNKCKILDHKHLVLKTLYFVISDLGGIRANGIRLTGQLLFLVSYKTTIYIVEESTWMSLIKSYMCTGYSY